MICLLKIPKGKKSIVHSSCRAKILMNFHHSLRHNLSKFIAECTNFANTYPCEYHKIPNYTSFCISIPNYACHTQRVWVLCVILHHSLNAVQRFGKVKVPCFVFCLINLSCKRAFYCLSKHLRKFMTQETL